MKKFFTKMSYQVCCLLTCLLIQAFGHAELVDLSRPTPQMIELLEVLSHTKLAVVSTVGTDPKSLQSSLVVYGNDQYDLYLVVLKQSQLYKNLKKNRNINFVMGFNERAIQYKGVAHKLDRGNPAVIKEFREKALCNGLLLANPNARYFKIKPKHLNLLNVQNCPGTQTFFNFKKNRVRQVSVTPPVCYCNPEALL